MAQSVVSIAIQARNLTGGVWRQLQAQIQGTDAALKRFQNTSNATRNAQGRLRDANGRFVAESRGGISGLTGGVAGLSVGYIGLGAAINVATQAIGALSRAGNAAIQRQVEQVQALSTAMQTLGLSQQQAGRYTQEIEKDIARLGKDLPTSAESIQVFFRTIQDDYNLALKGSGASLDTIKKAQLSSSSRIALLSDLAGGDIGASRAAVSAFLGGSVGARGLNQYQFFANNPQLTSALKSGLTAKGVDSTGDLSAFERIKLFTEALEKAVTPEMINLLQGTVKARISAFMDSLFDPTIGLFSIERDLEPKIDGYQSVFTAFGDTLDIVVGQNGILSNLARLLGLDSVDPMRSLFDSVNRLNSWLLGISGRMAALKRLTGVDIGKALGSGLAQIVNYIFSLPSKAIAAISTLDYKELFKGLFYGVGEFFAQLDYKQLIGVYTLPTLIKAIAAIASGLFGAIYEVGAEGATVVKAKLADAVKPIFEVIDAIAESITNFSSSVQTKVSELAGFEPKSTPVSKIANTTATGSLFGGLGGIINSIGSFFSRADGFIPANNGLLGAIASEAARKPSGSDFVIANSSEAILTPRMLTNLTGNLLNVGSKTINFQPGSIVLNLPSGTPTEIAMEAIAILERAIAQELETRIA
jgi:hypothetical protein